MQDGDLTEEQEQMWKRLSEPQKPEPNVVYVDAGSMTAAQVKAFLKQIKTQMKTIVTVNNVR